MSPLPSMFAIHRVDDRWFITAPDHWPCGLTFDRRLVQAADLHALDGAAGAAAAGRDMSTDKPGRHIMLQQEPQVL
jgi:hypothetical protein